MKNVIIIFAVLLMVSITVEYVDAVELDHAIVADSSGSMAGFYNTGAIRMLAENLQKILGGAGMYLFSDRCPEQVGRADALKSINRDTRMDLAVSGFINQNPRPDAIWLITDNVQDRTETPYVDANTVEFYEILRQNDFAKIHIMPCFLDFDGKIYVNREGRQFAADYTGRKGLVIYGILIDSKTKPANKKEAKALEDARKKQFDDLASRFASTLTMYESKLLLAKPLDKATFDLKPADQVPGSDRANVSLNERGIFIGKGFKEGKPIPVVFYVKLLSKFEDLIVAGKVDASVIDSKFTSEGFRDAKVSADIFPEKVNVDPGKATETIYKVTININKVKMKLDPASIVRAALSGKPGTVEGVVRLVVQVPREGFRFTDGVLNRYNTDDIEDFRRIYGMGSLINYMPVDVTMIPIEYKMILAVSYPHWPLVLIIVLAVILVAIIFVLYRAISSAKAGKYAISVGNQEEKVASLMPIFGTFNIYDSGKSYGTISKNLGGAINAVAKKGLLIDGELKKKRLNNDIDSFNISDSEGTSSISVHFRSIKKSEKLEDSRSDLDNGF